ncbi:unnamed protein product [Adineta steineri]|uniref:Uncharacterized protein n=1 Tax=Adineta steineri TaxID=433720 RepID=A0A816AEX4_9BILA|nr:unnamed protein product [Adineta steineri]CAF1594958.1 unnamed protein product [Adineta steineri]
MDFAQSEFEAALASKRPLIKQSLTGLIDAVDPSELPTIYRSLFYRLNNHLFNLSFHNQHVDTFLSAKQLSFDLHEHFINKFSALQSTTIKQLQQILKSLQQQQPLTQNELNQRRRSQQG